MYMPWYTTAKIEYCCIISIDYKYSVSSYRQNAN
ncbi:hypothetical protein F-LCD7_0206 [Faustovirus]|nr:hypothetical protein F-LCD7_0206 [Faustovirus]